MSRHARDAFVLLLAFVPAVAVSAAESRFAETGSRSEYVHWIDLYDANNRKIELTDSGAPPYSPRTTCGRCHDYESISHGYHFNAIQKTVAAGRAGEPWIWTDSRTASQIPLSYRGWEGSYDPAALGIPAWNFVLQFGRHLPGGGPGQWPTLVEQAAKAAAAAAQPAAEGAAATPPADPVPGRWRLAGELEVDCMMCHSNDHAYSMEVWRDQIENQNFAWAPTAAAGLGYVEGKVSALPDDFDPQAAETGGNRKLPTITYAAERVNAEQRVFFNVIRTPRDGTCYYCHTTRAVGPLAGSGWNHDDDVHLAAGLSCSDCHRNGIDHHTVRGYEGEAHPTGEPVATLSCRGCHMDGAGAGRLGAPQPAHKGLPALHFDKLTCTACHSGPSPVEQAGLWQTSLAHGLGLPSHDYSADLPPGIVAPVFLRDGDTLAPHRMVWPAFWGTLSQDEIRPLNPEAAYEALRRTLRLRRGETWKQSLAEVKLSKEERVLLLGAEQAEVGDDQLTDEERAKLQATIEAKSLETFRQKLAEALTALKQGATPPASEPVYVAGGKAYRLGADGQPAAFDHAAARPYAWKLAHDVRPARASLGISGCYECHAAGTPIFEGKVTTISSVPEEQLATQAMYQLAGYDKLRLDAWNQSFQGRTAFKYLGFASMGVVALVLVSYLVQAVTAVPAWFRRR